jgi:hypothetical protein
MLLAEKHTQLALNVYPVDWGFRSFWIEERPREFAGQAAKMPDAGKKSGVVSSPLMLARSRSHNCRCQFHNALAANNTAMKSPNPEGPPLMSAR